MVRTIEAVSFVSPRCRAPNEAARGRKKTCRAALYGEKRDVMGKGTAILGFLLSFALGMATMFGIDSASVGGGHIAKDSAAAAPAGGAWTDEASPVAVSSKDPSWGNRNALVTIVEFSDFQCPFCSRVNPTLDALKKKYGPDKLRIVWKHAPLVHKAAKPLHAAAAAVYEVAGADAFWKFHDAAFTNAKADAAGIEKMAVAAGADAAKFKAALAAGMKKVEEDIALSRVAGVRGTPGFLINGEVLSGAQPQNKFEAVVDKHLALAQSLVAAGTPADQVYVAASKKNFKAAAAPAPRKPPAPVGPVYIAAADHSPRKGPKAAKVTFMEFLDFQ